MAAVAEPTDSPAPVSRIVTRITAPSEFRSVAGALSVSYLQEPPNDDAWAKGLPSWENMISYSSWDGERCAGHAGFHETETTVPSGERLGTAAVTRVGVVPTFTRLGVGTALMNAVMSDAIRRRLPLASLRASEAVIYRRYGFGVAGDFCDIAIDPARARPVTGAASAEPSRFRLLSPDEIESVTSDIDLRSLGRRPGLMTRPDTWRRRSFGEAIDQTQGAFVVVHLDSGGQPDGYVHYHCSWSDIFGAGGQGEVKHLEAVSDDVELALWAYLFDVDLVRQWTSAQRPVDDLIREAIHDRRAYKVKAVNDEQWLRLLDVDLALSTRTYNPVPGSLVVEVTDPLIVDNNRRWRIEAEGATVCEDEPDVSASIDALSAMYLGAGSWHTEAAVGRVQLVNAGASRSVLGLANQLFSHKPLPFCGTFF